MIVQNFVVLRHLDDEKSILDFETVFLAVEGDSISWTQNADKATLFPTYLKARNAAKKHDGLTSPAHCYVSGEKIISRDVNPHTGV